MSNVNSATSIKREKINKTIKIKSGRESGDYSVTDMKDADGAGGEIIEQTPTEVQMGICEKCLMYLYFIREPVADYQAKRGISKDEPYTFYSLVTSVGSYMFNSVSAMANMAQNLLPIVDAFLLIVRFVVDKLIEILESEENDRATKAVIFGLEFIPIFFILGFIYGFIFLPLYALMDAVMRKFWRVI